MRSLRLLAVVALGVSLLIPLTALATPASTGFVALPFRCIWPQAEADTVGFNAAWYDSIAPSGGYVWSWTIECASSATSTGLRYWFQPVGLDTSYIVRDTIEPGTSYTWDCPVSWIKTRGITAATSYRIRIHQD